MFLAFVKGYPKEHVLGDGMLGIVDVYKHCIGMFPKGLELCTGCWSQI